MILDDRQNKTKSAPIDLIKRAHFHDLGRYLRGLI